MFYFLNAFKELERTPFSPQFFAGMRLIFGSLLIIIITVLLTALSLTVHAQTEIEIISTPQELPVGPSADPTTSRAAQTIPATNPLDLVTIGLNFQGSELFVDSNFIPPDTMGAVGPDHIVEMINGRFDVYSKTNGTEVFTRSLDGFWTTVVGLSIPPGDRTFDPRIVFDPASGRWFATSIDRGIGTGNNIYLGRSDTDNPTGDWDGVRFAADTVFPDEFHDYGTLGVDADGLYVCTNDFFGGGNESCYSIPKADLLLAAPSIARMTRFEATPSGMPQVTGSVQPALDFGPSDGRAALLGVSFEGQLVRGNIFGADGAGASLGIVVNISGAPVTIQAPPARQPHPFGRTLENVSPRIVANVFEQGDSLWAVHAVLGNFSNSAVRWYEINEVTNTVLQTGLIQNPNEDYHEPSIAVNEFGNVVIGYTCSGPNLAPSACISVGETADEVTTFESPLRLQLGAGHYFQDFNTGRNRWGDYSATVIDPVDPCTFWTFQEFVAVSAGSGVDVGGSWGIQITELSFNNCDDQSIFADVPLGYWAEDAIITIYNAGITTGCSQDPLLYCPQREVNRAQMAVFLERGINGGSFTPPPATGIFDDVPVTFWAADWIEQLYNDGITTGCAQNPLRYCPDRIVNRAQMAVFLLRSKRGSNYTPPPATGIFADVPVTFWAADWIEQLYREGITTGCGTNPLRYCPDRAVRRDAMAVFLVRTFGL
jgi:hypothetical protein